MEYFVIGRELEKYGFYNDVKQVVFEFIGNNWNEKPELDNFDILSRLSKWNNKSSDEEGLIHHILEPITSRRHSWINTRTSELILDSEELYLEEVD